MTNLGKLVIESVLDQGRILDELIQLYIREELTGNEPIEYTTTEDFLRLKQLLEKSNIIGDLRQPLLEEVKRFMETDSAYLNIFTSLAPKIEGILRNICYQEGIQTKKTNLGMYIDVLRKAPDSLLRTGTLDALDGLFRSCRNIVEHGDTVQPGLARILCFFSFSMIEQIHYDYQDKKRS